MSSALEARIVDNGIGMEGGRAISQQGFGATIAGNEIVGAEIGIFTTGPTEEHGNLIEGNSIEGSEAEGIMVENDFNEIFGNEVLGAGLDGIVIAGRVPFGAIENLVGGDTPGSENVIAFSNGAAILVWDVEGTQSEVARNRGFSNQGLFIELRAAAPGSEPVGPNGGIEPPSLSSATQAGAAGSAEPGATVRLFRKQVAAAGEIESFLGEATADAEGNWEVDYGVAIPPGTIVAATQTSEVGGTSELEIATTAGAAGGGPGAGAGTGPAGPADASPPQTRIVDSPKKRIHSRSAQFGFRSDEAGSSFQCKLDRQPFRTCKSPVGYRGLKLGGHVFEVRAIDPAGNVDPTPAKARFTVLPGPR
jgi:hypothetical protein